MLVYSDVTRLEKVGAKHEAVMNALARAACSDRGIERHAMLVSAFMIASELVQGIADLEFERCGCDARYKWHDAGTRLLVKLAQCIRQSWLGGFQRLSFPAPLLNGLSGLDPTLSIPSKQGEGYAFYALYPEGYLEAAAHSGLGPDARIIGIRSIGIGLGAIVAAALDASLPVSVRPVGHPFNRELRVHSALARELTTHNDAMFAVVDEGPGLSGSSFGAVAEWLAMNGVPRERIHFFPSHRGDLGPYAPQGRRDRWKGAKRHVVSMDELLLQPRMPHQSLMAWVEEWLGPLEYPLEDISAGAWRRIRYSDEEAWPAANIQQERRKFLAHYTSASWLIKFVGLGDIGERKLQTSRLLHQAGFTSKVVGLCHGFLIECWHDDARSIDQINFDRRHLVERIGAYLAFRARRLSHPSGHGASPEELRHMACYNTHRALGPVAAAALENGGLAHSGLKEKITRVDTDNRMHAWEWLVVGGQLIKADALDHSTAHDLVGCQDITWDIAGAMIELSLTCDEADVLCTIVERESGRAVDPALLDFMTSCYLAFQLGACTMAADALGEGSETRRLRLLADRYAARLALRIGN